MRLYTSYICYFIVGILCLQGCSTSEQAADEQFVKNSDIQPYIEQWESNKDSIERLSTMEADLSLLIQALAVQTDLKSLPEDMQEKLTYEEHGNKPEPSSGASLHAPHETINKFFGVKFSRYLIEKGALNQLKDLKSRYEELFNVLQSRIYKQEQDGRIFYNLIIGPVKNPEQANQLCIIMQVGGNKCSIVEF